MNALILAAHWRSFGKKRSTPVFSGTAEAAKRTVRHGQHAVVQQDGHAQADFLDQAPGARRRRVSLRLDLRERAQQLGAVRAPACPLPCSSAPESR